VSQLTRIFLIKESERRQLFYFFGLFVLLGVGLALGRGSADAMFFKRYGIENLPVIYALLSGVLAIASLVYASYADRVPSEKFFYVLFSGLVLLVTASWYLIQLEATEYVFPLYYLIFEVGSELLPLHAMLYIGQNFETLQAKRLTPIIFAGAQVGRMLGGALLAVGAPIIGVPNMLLGWVAIGFVSMLLLWSHHRHAGVSPYYRRVRRDRSPVKQSIEQVMQGIRFSRQSGLIRASFYSLFFLVLSFYILVYGVNRIYASHFPTEETLGRFFGLLTIATGTLALVIQLFVTSRLLERFGVKKINLVYPVTTITAYIGLLISFALPAAIMASVNKDALMPAVRNPTRSLFFNVLPDYMQGRARALSLVLVMPAALAIAGGLLIAMQKVDAPEIFLSAGLFATICYLLSNILMNGAYVAALMDTLRERVFIRGKVSAKLIPGARDSRLQHELVAGVHHPNANTSVEYARMLAESHPDLASVEIIKRIQDADNTLRDRLSKLLVNKNLPMLKKYFRALPDDADDHLRSTILTILFDARDAEGKLYVRDCLSSNNARLVATGILGVYRYNIKETKEEVRAQQRAMLVSTDIAENMAALDLLTHHPDPAYYIDLLKLLGNGSERVQLAVLDALALLPPGDYPGLSVALQSLYRSFNHEVRAGCVECYRLLNDADRHRLTLWALEDSQPLVRQAALVVLLSAGDDVREAAIPWILENAGTPRAEEMLLESLLQTPLSKAVFQRIALEKARYARDLYYARCVLENDQPQSGFPHFRLMRIVLGERIAQVVNLCLTALKSTENADAIRIIQAGLNSGDSRQVANAREALHNLRHIKIVKMLDDVVSQEQVPGRLPTSGRCEFVSLAPMLEWCTGLPDPWLTKVARNLQVNIGLATNG
jgi:hypothetical protein